MNISEEKRYVYQLMREITEERRKLTEIYFSLKERLDELNKLEEKGLDELSMQGYFDLYKQREKEIVIDNIKRETKHIISKIESNNESEKETAQIDIERRKDNVSRKNGRYLNVDKVIGMIASVLKEANGMMRVKEIYNKVNEMSEVDIDVHNFRNNIMPRALYKNKNIQKVKRGYYCYQEKDE